MFWIFVCLSSTILNSPVVQFFVSKGIDVGIPYPYDKTSEKKQSLDNYILDDSVVKIIRMIWKTPVNNTFYKESPTIVRYAFFSHPYPAIATKELGYPDKASYYFTDADLE